MKNLLRRTPLNHNLKLLFTLSLSCLIISCSNETSRSASSVNEMSLPNEQADLMTPAIGASLLNCEELSSQFSFSQTLITEVSTVAAGIMRGGPVSEHCLLTGQMNQRVSQVDGKSYAIGFEMRLPINWNGRFFYQANGGIDGAVRPAIGNMLGRGALSTALEQGFAVISSDAGHQPPTPFFGVDPQARIDFGYNAVATLTPMAKALIAEAYGKSPDRSYIVGCSNGGRHAMVAATRFADQYDGN